MRNDRFRLSSDPEYGFLHLAPLPTPEELARFYRECYYELVTGGERFPEAARRQAGGEAMELERRWNRATLFADIHDFLAGRVAGKRVLEIGCGFGDLLAYLQENGYECVGIEPAAVARAEAIKQGLSVFSGTFEEYLAQSPVPDGFDACLLLNVLEHVPDPRVTVRHVRELLAAGGSILVRVPNDFSELQEAARRKIGGDPWWVAIPDHINYFSFSSLEALLAGEGFRVRHRQGDFPMEMFLLMGEDYVHDRSRGAACHRRRIELEMALPTDLRRRWGQALAEAGIGRNALIVAEKTED